MSQLPAPRSSDRPALSRRSFLKLGLAGAGALALRQLAHPLRVPGTVALATRQLALPLGQAAGAGGVRMLRALRALRALRVASALRLAVPHVFFPEPEALLSHQSGEFDLLLVPAYVAASLIQRGMLQAVDGAGGRAHDPEGVYTVPYTYRVGALIYADAWPLTSAPSWADLWHPAARVVWPASSRLAIGAALLRRCHSPNETHPGRLIQAEQDLAQLRPRIVAGTISSPNLAFSLASLAELGNPGSARLPIEGVPLLEYDWAIPIDAPQPSRARVFLRQMVIDGPGEAAPVARTVPLIPLMPLPDLTRAQHAQIWSGLLARSSLAAPSLAAPSLAAPSPVVA